MKQVNFISVQEWNKLVSETYNRPYNLQQQDGCKDRGVFQFSVPYEYADDFENDTVPEEVNHEDMGVSFKAWLERDPKQQLNSEDDWDRKHGLGLWWDRNFYPCIDMVIQDLHQKGLLAEGTYALNIDW